ncbi:multidrug efflux SMR transporter [Acinetobacter sp. ANC 4635]|uniref:DMT family transporter n=1 Tax=Acinetobacter sp. ANC 4635 TaxID=2529846 RepID=UPI0010396B4F|nr:multidrug efflux SMR transporter [Acinetobacter sp. ANC 4635]TCB30100.1 multidrug efflux SMR transporter [Acinetobacter sp. ANC 4635]
MAFLYLLIAILAEVLATSAMKASDGFSQLFPSSITILGYAFAIYFLSLTMKSIPIGITYALWSGAGIILVSLVGFFYYKQHLDVAAMIGLTFMIAGILIINLFSKSTHL